MSTEEAINTLDKAAASVSSNREGHELLKEAVRVIREALAKK